MRRRSLLAALFASTLPFGASAQDADLPAYFEWFMKEGSQVRTTAEAERDTRIAAGTLAPLTLDLPLPDLSLPDASGAPISLRSIAGKKRLVVVIFRTWW